MSEKLIAKYLLEIGAVFLRPDNLFTWASGIKSPVYCDNRIILSHPEIRNKIENALANLIIKNYSQCEVIAGTSTAGIPHAAIVAEILKLPMIYVRTKQKDHGRENLIEGKLNANQKVVVIEDLISTGKSVLNVVNTLRDAHANVLGIASIFNYGMQISLRAFQEFNIKNFSLSNYKILIQTALDNKLITQSDLEKLIFFE